MCTILNPETDVKRLKGIRKALVSAYTSMDKKELAEATKMMRDYSEEGFNDYKAYSEDVEDYKGNDPEMLAEQYIQRVFHNLYMDDDEDQYYIETGLPKPFHVIRSAGREFTEKEWSEYCRDGENRIVTSFGKYDFNDCDICLNPETMTIASKKGSYEYNVTLKWCYCGNGLWSYGLDYNTGMGGGGFGCSYADETGNDKSYRNGYRSEKECIIAACDKALSYLQKSDYGDERNRTKLIGMVTDYKKSIGRPEPVQLSLFD